LKTLTLRWLGVFLAIATPITASTIWHEGDDGQGDAGGTPATANITYGSGTLTAIDGSLSNITGGADMYEIYISDPSTFSAETAGRGATDPIVNPSIYLFNVNGIALFGEDNISGSNAQAEIPAGTLASLTAGYYYILLTPSGRLPRNAEGQDLFGDDTNSTGLLTPSGSVTDLVIDRYATSGTTPNPADAGSDYEIDLTGADFVPAPEPATVGFVVVGLALLGGLSRRSGLRTGHR
jgi:hypothetical protein